MRGLRVLLMLVKPWGGVFGNSTVGETDQSGAVIKIYGMKSQFDSGLKVVCYTKEKRKSNEQCEQS